MMPSAAAAPSIDSSWSAIEVATVMPRTVVSDTLPTTAAAAAAATATAAAAAGPVAGGEGGLLGGDLAGQLGVEGLEGGRLGQGGLDAGVDLGGDGGLLVAGGGDLAEALVDVGLVLARRPRRPPRPRPRAMASSSDSVCQLGQHLAVLAGPQVDERPALHGLVDVVGAGARRWPRRGCRR